MHRCQLGHRCQDTRPTQLDTDRIQDRLRPLCGKFVSDGPAWGLGGGPDLFLQGDGIKLYHRSVRRVGEALTHGVEVFDGRPYVANAFDSPEFLDPGEFPLM